MRVDALELMNADKQCVRALVDLQDALSLHATIRHMAQR